FTRVRALFRLGRTILAGDTHVRSFETIGDGFERRENRCDHDFAMICVRDQRLQCERGINRLTHGLVHLPVSGDYGFTHRSIFIYRGTFEIESLPDTEQCCFELVRTDKFPTMFSQDWKALADLAAFERVSPTFTYYIKIRVRHILSIDSQVFPFLHKAS